MGEIDSGDSFVTDKINLDETKDPMVKEQKEQMEAFIENSDQLKNIINLVENFQSTPDTFYNMLDEWNKSNSKIDGLYVEKKYEGAEGKILKIRMDYKGNVQLAGQYEKF